ncbi:MAG: hypothetical protein HYS25_13515 [Ignavibacteriales bacterium]|nr:hypothetical protein [Ignavibacteriales bacterium]
MAVTQEAINRAVEITKQFGVSKLVLFGSAVDDIQNAEDLDFAVEGVKGWDIIRLAAISEDELKINVDVVPIEPNNKFIAHILNYGKVLYS